MQMWPLLSQRVGSSSNSSRRCVLQGKGTTSLTQGAAVEDTHDVLSLLLHATQTAHSFTHSPLIIKSTRFAGPNQ